VEKKRRSSWPHKKDATVEARGPNACLRVDQGSLAAKKLTITVLYMQQFRSGVNCVANEVQQAAVSTAAASSVLRQTDG